MNRDEIKKDITEAIDKQFPENVDLDGDDLDTVERAVEETLKDATDALDSGNDEDDDDAVETEGDSKK